MGTAPTNTGTGTGAGATGPAAGTGRHPHGGLNRAKSPLSAGPSAPQYPAAIPAVVAVSATGWDGVYVADHFMGDAGGPVPEDVPTLAEPAVVDHLLANRPQPAAATT